MFERTKYLKFVRDHASCKGIGDDDNTVPTIMTAQAWSRIKFSDTSEQNK
jgi:hypothetical protein